jgi:hypothetical protein
LQIRQDLDEATIAHYVESEAYQAPPTVYEIEDGTRLLAGGFHRVEAAKRAGVTEITVELRPGTRQVAPKIWWLTTEVWPNVTPPLRSSYAERSQTPCLRGWPT